MNLNLKKLFDTNIKLCKISNIIILYCTWRKWFVNDGWTRHFARTAGGFTSSRRYVVSCFTMAKYFQLNKMVFRAIIQTKLWVFGLSDLRLEIGFELVAVLASEWPQELSILCVLHSNIDNLSKQEYICIFRIEVRY